MGSVKKLIKLYADAKEISTKDVKNLLELLGKEYEAYIKYWEDENGRNWIIFVLEK